MALVLSACGGGGGGSAGGNGGGDSPTGLVPATPALGATLLADATTLRPLRAGAEWQYRGTRQSGTSVLNTYATTTRHAAAAGGGVNETQQGGIAGPEPDSVTISAEGGRLVAREGGAFLGLPAGEQLVTVELRSPVRVNDQITLIDRSGLPAGDLDGDRLDDTSQVAAWSRVVRWEDRRGHLVGVQELPGVLPANLTPLRPHLLPTGAGAALLVPEPRGLSSASDLRLRRLGADGRLLDANGTLLTIGASDPANPSVASDGATLWVLASVFSNPGTGEMELRLQAFDAILRTPEHLVPLSGRVLVIGSDANRLVLARVATQ